ncbi:MAG TPA: ATP-dependent helicase C-terminal domain-containing protein [Vicinamibacterales bacterium]
MLPLPIDAHLDEIRDRLRHFRALVIVAAPGAGKTTRVPPALAEDGPVIVLQPRRVAARAIAWRIAVERGWTLGEEVGWHVRFERRFSPRSRVLLATEGILTARLQEDPLASAFRTIVLDEFHERSIHVDLGLALAKQAWLARDDLRLVVMSATLEAAPVSAYLGSCPIVEVPGEPHRLEIEYAPGQPLAGAVREMWHASRGSVLCFLPGAPEIARAIPDVSRAVPGVPVVPLHGSLPPDEQDRALSPNGRRIVLATNLAETSVTVSGVDAVVDTGLHKVARYDPARAIDALVTERISEASADQRAGRAARLGPGRARRLWDRRDRLRPHREPDVARIDLSGTLLDLFAWGADPGTFDWFEAPPPAAIEAAHRLLERLGAIDGRTLTPLGRAMQRLPVPPRLARIVVEARGAREAVRACAVLAEGELLPPRHDATTCDLLAALDAWRDLPPHVHRVARQLEEMAAESGSSPRGPLDERELRRALFAGYPDRLAKRREPRGRRVLLASGAGADLSEESGVGDAEYLIALDVQAASHAGGSARIRIASAVDPEWIVPTGREMVHAFDESSGRVRAWRRDRYDAIVLAEHPVAPAADAAAALIADAWLARGPSEADRQLLRRLQFAGVTIDVEELVRRASAGAASIDEVDIAQHLPPGAASALDRLAPRQLRLPTGRFVPLEYEESGEVSARVKLQELFGMAETPRIGARGHPVLLYLLAPNGRPVQTTRDLRSFWDRTYPEVRKELRGRYPKHPWPEDPWTATPTARTKPGASR